MQINPAALKAIRESNGHSQLSLSKATGVSQGHISDIESKGDTPIPIRPGTAKKLAEGLRVPLTAITVPEQVSA